MFCFILPFENSTQLWKKGTKQKVNKQNLLTFYQIKFQELKAENIYNMVFESARCVQLVDTLENFKGCDSNFYVFFSKFKSC